MTGTTYKISELPAVTTLASNNVLPVVDLGSSTTKKATVQQILNFVTGTIINNLSVTEGSFSKLNSTILTSSNASITTLNASVISASSYINLPNLPAGGTNGSIQYNSGGFNTGNSNKLVFDYVNNFFGVGANPPLSHFHIKKYGELARLESTVLRGNGTNYMAFYDPVGRKGYFGYGGSSNDHLNISNEVSSADITFITNGLAGSTEKIRITSEGNLGVATNNPNAGLHVDNSKNIKSTGDRHNFNIRAVTIEGSPCEGTYKGYIILGKKHPNPGVSIVDASYVIGKIYLRRGTFGSGHRVDIYEVASSIGYNGETFYVNLITPPGTQSTFVSKLVTCTYGGQDYHAIELTNAGGSPSTEVTFEGVTKDSPLILTDASFVTGVTSFGSVGIVQDGNVGIGTLSPETKLHVSGGSGIKVNSINNNWATFGSNNASSNYLSFLLPNSANALGHIGGGAGGSISAGTQNDLGIRSENNLYLAAGGNSLVATLLSNGNVGIGTTSPVTKLDVNGDINITNTNNLSWGGAYSSGNPTIAGASNGVNSRIGFYPQGNVSGEKITISAAGNLGLGTTSPSYLLQLTADSAAKPSTNTWTIASDIRVKENVKNYSKGLETLTKLNPVTYDYNGKAGFNSELKNNIGLIAQDILDVLPESVSTFKAKLNSEDINETELYNFNSHALTYIMINSIKELVTEVNNLKTQIEILKSGSV